MKATKSPTQRTRSPVRPGRGGAKKGEPTRFF
jgi:hypothetical protein